MLKSFKLLLLLRNIIPENATTFALGIDRDWIEKVDKGMDPSIKMDGEISSSHYLEETVNNERLA